MTIHTYMYTTQSSVLHVAIHVCMQQWVVIVMMEVSFNNAMTSVYSVHHSSFDNGIQLLMLKYY